MRWAVLSAVTGMGLLGSTALGSGTSTTAAPQALPWPGVSHTFTNPLNVPIADPFVLQEGDTYYMYGTTDYGGAGFHVFTSTDLVRWTRGPKIYRPAPDSWGRSSFWAPEVIRWRGRYYLHYTAYNPQENRRNILVAVADSALGPFQDYAGPLFPRASIIDSHIYHDDASDKLYIYASPEHSPPSRIVGAELSADLKSLATSPTTCLTSEYGWEDLWIEGPIIEKYNDRLYMIYSGGAFWEPDYALGYATASHPLGPWEKSTDNPILKKAGPVEGPGHNGLARSPDGSELFVVYHRHRSPRTTHRVAALDRLYFEQQTSGPDKLRMHGAPSYSPQPLPSGAAPLMYAASDDFTSTTVDGHRWEIFSNSPRHWRLTSGVLTIQAGAEDFWRGHQGGENVFLQRIPPEARAFAIETSVTMDARHHHDQAFLIFWSSPDDYVMFSAALQDEPRLVIMSERDGKANASLAPNRLGWPVRLKIERQGDHLKMYASATGGQWQQVGKPVDISQTEFTHVGLGAWSPGSTRRSQATFDYFRVLPASAP